MKKTLLLLICGLMSFGAYSQMTSNPYPVEGIFSKNVTGSNKYGKVKAQKIKGKVTGTGLQKGKDGSLYAGDFKDKIPHGKGMLISAPGLNLDGCPQGLVYVGRFKEGLKEGNGKVYDANGELIYKGKFKDDAPVGDFPGETDYENWFTELKGDGSTYIGEMEGNAPSGFGLIIFSDNSYLVSNFKDGNRDGVTVYMQADGNWISENVDGDSVTPISSSEEYATLEANSKAVFRAALSEALNYFAEGLAVTAQGISNYREMKHGSYANTDFSGYSDDTSNGSTRGSSGKTGNSKGNGFSLSEQQSYNTDKSTYARYDSTLAQIFAGNRQASSSEIKQMQDKMKSLRKKWEAKNKSFPKSANEDR